MQVVLTPGPTVSFRPHPEHDCQEFASMTHLATRVDTHGYYGGVRLLMVRLGSTTGPDQCSCGGDAWEPVTLSFGIEAPTWHLVSIRVAI